MRLHLVVSVVALGVLCAACSESTAGQPSSTPSSGPAGSSAGPVPTTSAPADSGMKGKTEFTQDELCDLLTTTESQQLGGGSAEGQPGMNVLERSPICQWKGDATILTVGYRPNAVVADLESGPTIKKSSIEVNGIPAVLSNNSKPGGLCQVGIDLTDHSDLVVGATVNTAAEGEYDKCTVAKQMATMAFSKVK